VITVLVLVEKVGNVIEIDDNMYTRLVKLMITCTHDWLCHTLSYNNS